MMIDENETFKRFGYWSTNWAPNSCKKVVAVCDGCGEIREIQKRFSDKMCLKCACNTLEHKAVSSRTHHGKIVSEEQKRKQREKMSGRKQSVEHIKKRADAVSASWTDERKETQSQSMLGEKNHNYGKPMSPEARAKNSRSHTGLHASDETKQTMSNVRKGVLKSDETKARMKAHSSSPDGRKRRSAHMADRYSTPDGRERQSANLQGQDYDAGEWTGFTDKSRPHLLPIHACTKINERFPGCEGHHLSRSLVVFIPDELHKHVNHNISTNLGMAEMNALALQFAL